MGMSTHIIGFREPDEKWRKMKEVYDVCEQSGVNVPDEVNEFFDWESPSEEGIKVDIDKLCEVYAPHDCTEGFKIDISKLPDNITHICFWNSY